jgi:hypothetical protein
MDLKPFQTPAPHITRADRPAANLAADMQALVARQRAQAAVEESTARLRWLLAHPAPSRPATAGELAEQRHLLYDADPDSTIPAFRYPTAQEAS